LIEEKILLFNHKTGTDESFSNFQIFKLAHLQIVSFSD